MIALAPGASIGRYVLESQLAAGGMAEVWLARARGPEGFEKTVASQGLYPTRRHVATQLETLFPQAERETPSRRGPVSSSPTFRRSRHSHREPDAVVAFETGLDLIRSRDYPGARAALERALLLDPENRVYRSNLNKLRQRLEDRGGG